MPFGLKNAPAFFQRLMDTTLRAQYQFCRCYIDDVIIFSKSFDEHLVHLRAVLERLRAKLIRCHPTSEKASPAVPMPEGADGSRFYGTALAAPEVPELSYA
jgi:hypothetical protein